MLHNLEWKKKFLEVENISLQEAMDKVHLWETAQEEASQMANHNRDVGASTKLCSQNKLKRVLIVAGKVISPATRSAQLEGESA